MTSFPARAHGDDPALPLNSMAWIILIVAGLFEVAWATGLKYTEGFTRAVPSIATGIAIVISMGMLGLALRTLPLGTAYAVWTGIGTVGTAILGIVLFREPATAARLVCIALIVVGIVGLKLTAGR
ncbi:MAG TPA: quaternary ammonium compound efflux SMR transporter SugE [Longimicrobiales bacterium]|nr:quaternary ammonium compound efflux SMR transporter SugE [Longimicrobiales bacterium]